VVVSHPATRDRRQLSGRAVPGYALALILCCATTASTTVANPTVANQEPESQPHPNWSQTFDDFLPRFERALAGEGEFKPSHLAWLYRKLLFYRAEFPDSWPAEVDFAATIDRIHALRIRSGQSGAAFAENDWSTDTNYDLHGRSVESRAHLQRVVDLYELGTPHLGGIHLLLAGYARQCREWSAAREHLLAAERTLAAEDDPARGWAVQKQGIDVLLERSACWIGVGANDLALGELREARARAEVLADPETLGVVVLEELNLAVAIDAHHQSALILERARAADWYADIPDSLEAEHQLRVAVGRGEQERQDPSLPPEAIPLLEAVIARPELPGGDRLIGQLRLAGLYLEAGRLDDCALLADRCRGQFGSSDNPCERAESNRRTVDLAVLDARLGLARGAARDELEQTLARLRETFGSMLAGWRDAPTRDAGLGLLHTRDRLGIAEVLVSLVLALEGEEGPARALAVVAQVQAEGSLARALGARAPTVEEVLAEVLPPGGGLLVLLPGAAVSHLFCVDAARGVTVHTTPPVYRLDPLRRELLEQLTLSLRAHRETPRLEPALAELSRLLLPQDVRDRIRGWSELAVVGVDGAGYVPFELLRGPGNERLGDLLPVRYLPSLAVAMHLARRSAQRPPAGTGISLFAAPDAQLDGNGSRGLDFGSAELQRLREVAPFTWEPRLARAATLDGLRTTDLRGAFALHLIAHGAPTQDSSRPAGLVLHGSGGPQVLTPAMAEALRVPRLVFLTACSTWRGPLRRGDDGRHHIGGSLLLAGADNVLLSTLEVEYRSHLALLAEFYRALAGGADPAHALHAARLARRADPSPGRYLIHAVGPPLPLRVPLAAVENETHPNGLLHPSVWIGLAVLSSAVLLVRRRRVSS
jgi:CHAT domain